MKMQVHDNLAELLSIRRILERKKIRIKWMNSYLH